MLKLLNLPLDRYERKARLIPAIAACLPAIPGIASLFSFSDLSLAIETSISSFLVFVIAVIMSYAASLVGRRYERKLWPRSPNDLPTNEWLTPNNTLHSQEQKRIWYEAIRRCTGFDIQEAIHTHNSQDLDRLINDAVRTLRQQFRDANVSDMLFKHNVDYGFSRNLAGSGQYGVRSVF